VKREQIQNIVPERNDESLLMTAEINGFSAFSSGYCSHLPAVSSAFYLTIVRLSLRNIDPSPLK